MTYLMSLSVWKLLIVAGLLYMAFPIIAFALAILAGAIILLLTILWDFVMELVG
jgi:hypothetical protein